MIFRGTVHSKTLGIDTGLVVVTPAKMGGEKYKVAYLLHGVCGNSNSWTDHSMLLDYAREGDTIYIMPDGARSFYTNMKHGYAYYDYISKELPEICKSLFNICTDRENTIILGDSMGGYGALKIALSNPEVYGMCAAFSPGCLFLKKAMDYQRNKTNIEFLIKKYGKQLIDDFYLIFGDALEWSPDDEILELVKKASRNTNKPEIYITCGTGDFLINDCERFSEEMKKYDFKYTYEKWDGEHNYKFFNQSLGKAIQQFSL